MTLSVFLVNSLKSMNIKLQHTHISKHVCLAPTELLLGQVKHMNNACSLTAMLQEAVTCIALLTCLLETPGGTGGYDQRSNQTSTGSASRCRTAVACFLAKGQMAVTLQGLATSAPHLL